MTQQHNDTDQHLSVEHLSLEAIAALADGELSRKAEHRAKIHLVHCMGCRDQVRQQREASERLREEWQREQAEVKASGSLIERLSRIPEISADVPRPRAFGVDGCRHPETFVDSVDLMLRKLQRLPRRTK